MLEHDPRVDDTTLFTAIGDEAKPRTRTPRHLALIGFMGAGKTTVAREIAHKTSLKLVDTDEIVEQRIGMPIAKFFSLAGESAFRDLETSVLHDALTSPEPSVIACGGGVIIRPENVALLEKYALTVYLMLDPDQAIARFDDYTTRPLLSQAGSTEAVFALMEARVGLYEAAADIYVSSGRREIDLVVDTVIERAREAGFSEEALSERH